VAKASIAKDKSKVLEVTSTLVSANPGCACEVVKAAIKASEANAETVAAIVEVAAQAAPEHSTLVAKCALAAAPEAGDEVAGVMKKVKLFVASDSKGGISAKGGEVAEPVSDNPLDFPGGNMLVGGSNPNTDWGIAFPPGTANPGPGGGTPPGLVNPPGLSSTNPNGKPRPNNPNRP
jgi:hypothetical protein